MASYNKIILSGYVKELPVLIEDEYSFYKKTVTVELMIERPELNLHDILTIKAHDACADRMLRELKKNEYFVSESIYLRTVNYEKKIEIVCPQCQTVSTITAPAEKTEIICNDFIIVPKTKVLTLLGTNRAIMLGNICSKLNFRTMNNGKSYLKYKLAVNRDGWMKKFQHADYPFVVSFGQEADTGNRYLEVSDLVLVEGAIQERLITQNYSYLCKECDNIGNEYVKTPVVEVIASNVEYLKGIKTKTETELYEDIEKDKNALKNQDKVLNGEDIFAEEELIEAEIEEENDLFDLSDIFG